MPPGADALGPPLRVLQGIPYDVAGLLVDTDGTIYVSSRNPATETIDPNSGMIFVYAPGASGLATPIRTIAGNAVSLNIPVGMAFGP